MTDQPIEPRPPERELHELVERLLGTRPRDLPDLEAAHRELLDADAVLHRRLLSWLADTDPESRHLSVGLAVLATGPDPEGRRFVTRLVGQLPLRAVADTVDYIHGWRVEVLHTKKARKRYQDSMTAAYEASAGEVKSSLEQHQGSWDDFVGGEILVTLGAYDKVQQVLDYLDLPYRTLPCGMMDRLHLRADQAVIVNCPGKFSASAIEKLRRFVAAGGTLITTDWALKTTIEHAFPDTIKYNGRPTADDVVTVSWVEPDSPYTRGVEVEGQPLSWWLEGSSYPIQILDRRVRVLMRSEELGKKWSDDPVVVTFAYGEGMVFHLTSHYYLQRTKADAGKASSAEPSSDKMAAAYSSLRLLGNVLFERRRACGV